jgi:hypothetical protein
MNIEALSDSELSAMVANLCRTTDTSWYHDDSGPGSSSWRGNPNYAGDLNVIHKAIMTALEAPDKSDSRHIYRQWLQGICGTEWAAIDATARQRAEAFVLTMSK